MIEQAAIVTRTAGTQVWIKSLQAGGCGGCSQQTSCGSATLAKILPKREFCVETDLSFNVGEQVIVEIDDSHLLTASILLYMLPIVLMLLIVGFANALLPADIGDNALPIIAVLVLSLIHI